MKRLLIVMLAVGGLLLTSCSCTTWTRFSGGDPAKECADHWHWRKHEVVEPAPAVPVAKNPCAAVEMSKATQSYPVGEAGVDAARLEKMAPAEVRANEPFDYRIKVTNLTDGELHNVIVKDCVPENLKVKSSTPEISEMKEGEAHWMLGTLGPHASQMITVNAIAHGTGSFTSCAEVFYDRPICAKVNIVEPKLQLAKYAPSESLTCDRIPLRYVVSNTGTGYACDITIKDELPEGFMTSTGERQVMFGLDSLGPGESREFEQIVDATKSGKYASKAVVVSRGLEAMESNMTETIVSQPVLAINESCPSEKYVGASLTYDITVTNEGDGAARETVIEAMVPEGVRFRSATSGGRFTHSSPGRVFWNVGTLEPDGSRKVSMTLDFESPGTFTSKAMTKAYCADTVSTSCQSVVLGIPAMLLEVVDVSDPIEVGRSEKYIISVTNQGSATGTNIQVSCMLEDGMEYISSAGPTKASIEENKISFGALASLAPKAKAEWHVNVRAAAEGDMRFRVMLGSDQLKRMVEETESTNFYAY
ncbi:MAG: DUF11 domain-containing protein [Planctomycetota bacterium]|nr:MAG: DUF11 domain-containing protein [Planctomycetota bacterium]